MLHLSGGQASVEGDLEGVERGFPSVGPALLSLAGGVEAHDREVDALQRGRLGREVPAGVDCAPDPGVDALDGIGGANDRADFPVKLEERHELRPRISVA